MITHSDYLKSTEMRLNGLKNLTRESWKIVKLLLDEIVKTENYVITILFCHIIFRNNKENL